MRVFHGTSDIYRRAILRQGLVPKGTVPVWVTEHERSAVYFAARAVCVEMYRRGMLLPQFAKPAVVFELDVPESDLVPDHVAREAGAYVVMDGCPASMIVRHRVIDLRANLVRGQIRAEAEAALRSRAYEGSGWGAFRREVDSGSEGV